MEIYVLFCGTAEIVYVTSKAFADGTNPSVSFTGCTVGDEYLVVAYGYQSVRFNSITGMSNKTQGNVGQGAYRIGTATSTTIKVTATLTGSRNNERALLFHLKTE